MAERVEIIKRNYGRLKSQRANWEEIWQEIADYIIPQKNQIQTRASGGEKRTEKQFDSTAQDANDKLAAAIHGALSGPTNTWFNLRTEVPELLDDPEVNYWVSGATDKIFTALQQSNFDGEIEEVYSDVSAFGTGALGIEEHLSPGAAGFGGLRFESLQIGTYCIDEGADGLVNTVMRTVTMSRAAWAEKLPDGKFSSESKEKLKENPHEKVTYLHVVQPRMNVPKQTSAGTRAKKMPIESLYVETENEWKILHESGFAELPFAVVRWRKDSGAGENFGRGRGEVALPDIRTLNRAVEMRLKAWAKAIDPPIWMRDRGVIGRVRLRPGSINTVRDGEVFGAMPMGAQFDVANFHEEQLRTQIRGIFYNDQLQLPDKSIITATEADRRIELMQRLLGPALSRLDLELLAVVINRVFQIMLRAEVLGPPPDTLLEAAETGGGNLAIEYSGPLARAQRGADLVGQDRFLASILPLRDMNPEVMDLVNLDEYVRSAGESALINKRILRTSNEVRQIREQRAAEAARQQQIQENAITAQAAGRAAPAIQAIQEGGGIPDDIIGEGEFEEVEE